MIHTSHVKAVITSSQHGKVNKQELQLFFLCEYLYFFLLFVAAIESAQSCVSKRKHRTKGKLMDFGFLLSPCPPFLHTADSLISSLFNDFINLAKKGFFFIPQFDLVNVLKISIGID